MVKGVNMLKILSDSDKSKIIRAALADDTPFESIAVEYGLSENEVVRFMKKSLSVKQFIKWRVRARGSDLKHLKKHSQGTLKNKKTHGKISL